MNLKLTGTNELMLGANTANAAILIRFNDKGQILSDLRFNSSANKIKDFAITKQGDNIVLLENYRKQTGWDILIVKLK